MIKKLSKKFNFWIGAVNLVFGGYLFGKVFSCKRKILAFIASIWCIFIGHLNVQEAKSDVEIEKNNEES